MRDKIKDEAYFKEYIDFEIARLQKRKELIKKIVSERGVDDAVKTAFLSILNYGINLLNAEYSSGLDLSTIKETLSEVIDDNTQTSFENRYVEFLWLLSLSVLLDISKDDLNKILSVAKRDKIEDFITDTIINHIQKGGTVHEKIKFPTPYQSLKEVITLASTDKQKATERLKSYLDKEWYKGHSDTGWYNSHKSDEDIYSGYWSWESGALVKILGLDDSSLKEQQYYPYDMVHWKD